PQRATTQPYSEVQPVYAAAPPAAAPGNPAAPAPSPIVNLAIGTNLPVRLQETLDTRRNRAGDRFTAVLDEPLTDGNRVIVPKATLFWAHIRAAKVRGRLRGGAMMAAPLDSFQLNGQNYTIHATSAVQTSRGHKRRNWAFIGGSSAGGAAIGAAA